MRLKTWTITSWKDALAWKALHMLVLCNMLLKSWVIWVSQTGSDEDLDADHQSMLSELFLPDNRNKWTVQVVVSSLFSLFLYPRSSVSHPCFCGVLDPDFFSSPSQSQPCPGSSHKLQETANHRKWQRFREMVLK